MNWVPSLYITLSIGMFVQVLAIDNVNTLIGISLGMMALFMGLVTWEVEK